MHEELRVECDAEKLEIVTNPVETAQQHKHLFGRIKGHLIGLAPAVQLCLASGELLDYIVFLDILWKRFPTIVIVRKDGFCESKIASWPTSICAK